MKVRVVVEVLVLLVVFEAIGVGCNYGGKLRCIMTSIYFFSFMQWELCFPHVQKTKTVNYGDC